MNLPHMASECNTQIFKLIIEVSEVERKIQLPGTQHLGACGKESVLQDFELRYKQNSND